MLILFFRLFSRRKLRGLSGLVLESSVTRDRTLTYIALQILLISVMLTALIMPAHAAIGLSSFTATPGDGEVLVEWETETEFDIVGFNLLRSDQESGEYQVITDLFEAQGSSSSGASYSYTDENLTNGVTYYYKLQAIHADQSTEEEGPINATPGSATPTPTETQVGDTPDPTDTSTPEPSDTPTLTPTYDSYPEPATIMPSTPYPGIATTRPPTPYPGIATTAAPTSTSGPATRTPTSALNLTPSPTVLNSGTPEKPNAAASSALTTTLVTSPTATLLPFPTITLEFPATALAAVPQSQPLQAETTSPPGRGFSRYLPLGFILLIWLILGVWFYFSSRSLE